MIVSRENFIQTLDYLSSALGEYSLDSETTGLHPYHGDKLFSIIIGIPDNEFYFNFNPDPLIDPNKILPLEFLPSFQELFSSPGKTWYLHNAKYDMAILKNSGLELKGRVVDTKVIARIRDNNLLGYSLADCAKRIGFEKDNAVEEYISKHKLWAWQSIPGKAVRTKNKYYDKVPFEIISKYGQTDARITLALANAQKKALEEIPRIDKVVNNEIELTQTVYRMEQIGVKIDKNYCERAALYEHERSQTASNTFSILTGHAYKASPVLFGLVFADQKHKWEYTDKNNPSFDGDILKKFTGPIAECVLELRDAKAKADFYNGFLYHADSNNIVHPNLDQAGTASGRFSSSNPNFQNLTDDDTGEFRVRRALVPRPGYCFFMPDWIQMEYKLMLDYAARVVGYKTPLVEAILGGADVHQATADLVRTVSGIDIGRSKAKNGNFAKLYGAGLPRLAETLKCDLTGARAVSEAIETAAPEIARFCDSVIETAQNRGYILNWYGRKLTFENPRFAYKAPNYLIQGGCADIAKIAMNRVSKFLEGKKSRLILAIHDEFVIELHETELDLAQPIADIMSQVYPFKYLPLNVSMEYSWKNMADKEQGLPKK